MTVYPLSELLACNGLLVRHTEHNSYASPMLHQLENVKESRILVRRFPRGQVRMLLAIATDDLSLAVIVKGVGMSCVRTLQRWFRRTRWQPRALALMMATHKRLGADCPIAGVHADILRLCTRLF